MMKGHESRISDIEMGLPVESVLSETDKSMGIDTPSAPSEATKQSVEQVDNQSNFVFSSFHDLNLFIILQMENKLLHARRKLYDGDGLPQAAHGWTDDHTKQLQIHLKQYRNNPSLFITF